MKKIVFTGGGTGGHIFPNIAIINELKNKAKVFYIGSNGMEKEIIKKEKIKFYEIPTCKFKRSFALSNLLIPFTLIKSIKMAKKILKEIKPDAIFSKGGYVSLPVVFAGKSLKIPVVCHESDLSLGLSNKLCLKKCTKMCTSFKRTADSIGKKGYYTGSPIRKEILKGNKQNAIKLFKNFKAKPTILIIGGSLGSKIINENIFKIIKKLQNYNVIHLTGKNNINPSLNNLDGYVQLEFSENIEDLYAVCDIVISRAGSNVINEILALKKPNILIPLSKKASRGDQILNAKYFEDLGYSYVLEEENLNSTSLLKAIEYVNKNKEKYISKMKKAENNIANDKIIDLLLNLEK